MLTLFCSWYSFVEKILTKIILQNEFCSRAIEKHHLFIREVVLSRTLQLIIYCKWWNHIRISPIFMDFHGHLWWTLFYFSPYLTFSLFGAFNVLISFWDYFMWCWTFWSSFCSEKYIRCFHKRCLHQEFLDGFWWLLAYRLRLIVIWSP